MQRKIADEPEVKAAAARLADAEGKLAAARAALSAALQTPVLSTLTQRAVALLEGEPEPEAAANPARLQRTVDAWDRAVYLRRHEYEEARTKAGRDLELDARESGQKLLRTALAKLRSGLAAYKEYTDLRAAIGHEVGGSPAAWPGLPVALAVDLTRWLEQSTGFDPRACRGEIDRALARAGWPR